MKGLILYLFAWIAIAIVIRIFQTEKTVLKIPHLATSSSLVIASGNT